MRVSAWLRVPLIVGLGLSPLAVAAQTPKPAPKAAQQATPGPAKAVMPGFETLPDGSTRLFVELSGPVSYDTKTAASATNYILKGTHVAKQNNCNPLVTEYFNTPVTTARLVPHGHDLWLVIEMRTKVDAAVSLDTAADGAVTFSVRFPKGDYLPAAVRDEKPLEFAATGDSQTAPAPTSATAVAPTARPAGMGRGRGAGGGGGGRSGGGGGRHSRGTQPTSQ